MPLFKSLFFFNIIHVLTANASSQISILCIPFDAAGFHAKHTGKDVKHCILLKLATYGEKVMALVKNREAQGLKSALQGWQKEWRMLQIL